jgi:serine/threonine protein kinase
MAEARRTCPTCGVAYAGEALFCPADGAPLAARPQSPSGDPYLGREFAGLKLERLIGIGSMGRVYRAWQAVAIKILHRELMKKDTIVARFVREGRVAGGLAHPNVIAVHDAGTLPATPGTASGADRGEPYLVMEFLDGLSLRSALAASSGPLPLIRTLHVVLQICDAMGEAHARGVVHRDLKPENVMLVRRGADPDFVKVLDFGVARIGEADSSLATHAGALLGTATYACPESARGERVGQPGDVYSIATLLFECLEGAPPFRGKSAVDLLIQHAQADVPDLRSRNAGVPDPILKVVTRNLSKAPEARAPDARELGRELLAAARQSGFSAEAVSPGATLSGSPAVPSRTAVRLATALVGAAWLALSPAVRAAPSDAERDTPDAAAPATSNGTAKSPVSKGIKVAPVSAPGGDAGTGSPEAEPAPAESAPSPGSAPGPSPSPSRGSADGPSTPMVDAGPPISGTAPLGMRHAKEDAESETRGQIEMGVGLFTLPGAEICIATLLGCSKGDTSLALSAWPTFRRGRFAIGAGLMLGITASADAPQNDPPDVPRDHTRRYYSAEITGRYYVPFSERMEGWLGVTTGLGVVNDTFLSQKGLTEKAVPGPRGSTLLTEGFTLGVGVGLSHQLSEKFSFGGGLRVGSWFLPDMPAVNPLGDRASLTGSVAIVDLGITLAYRSRLAF